ncbi:hypothetical protein KFZ73_28110, partial [Tsukamurella paurometabola]|nr:hypothetical protein [Tsukamurella paurometabola]
TYCGPPLDDGALCGYAICVGCGADGGPGGGADGGPAGGCADGTVVVVPPPCGVPRRAAVAARASEPQVG